MHCRGSDMGLKFLDVTAQVDIALVSSTRVGGGRRKDVCRITNNSMAPVDTLLLLIARGLSPQVALENVSGRTSPGDPYLREFLPDGVLSPGQSLVATWRFKPHAQAPPVSYTLMLLSGQGTPSVLPPADRAVPECRGSGTPNADHPRKQSLDQRKVSVIGTTNTARRRRT